MSIVNPSKTPQGLSRNLQQRGSILMGLSFSILMVTVSYFAYNLYELNVKTAGRFGKKTTQIALVKSILNTFEQMLENGNSDLDCAELDTDIQNILDFSATNSLALDWSNTSDRPKMRCFLHQGHEDLLGSLQIKVNVLSGMNADAFSKTISAQVDLKLKGYIQKYSETRRYNVGAASLSRFGVILDPGAAMGAGYLSLTGTGSDGGSSYTREGQLTFHSDVFSLGGSPRLDRYIQNGKALYKKSLYLQSSTLTVSDFGELTNVEGKIKTNIFSQTALEMTIDSSHDSNWEQQIDYQYLYADSGNPLPNTSSPLGLSAVKSSGTISFIFDPTRAALTKVENDTTTSALGSGVGGGGVKLEETCDFSRNKVFIFTRPNQNFEVDFGNAKWSVVGNKPVFCSLVRAQKLIISTDETTARDYLMTGIFIIGSGGIEVRGKGRIHFINPLIDQDLIDVDLDELDVSFFQNIFPMFMESAIVMGQNFFLPLFITTTEADFLPRNYQERGILEACPDNASYSCFVDNMVKMDFSLLFPASGTNYTRENILFSLERFL